MQTEDFATIPSKAVARGVVFATDALKRAARGKLKKIDRQLIELAAAPDPNDWLLAACEHPMAIARCRSPVTRRSPSLSRCRSRTP